MWTHYILTLYRSLTRHRLYAALNVLGLAVGIAVFLVLWLDVRFETSFDRWIPNADNIYRFSSTYTFPGRAAEFDAPSSGAIAPALRADYPQAAATVRMMDSERPLAAGSILGSEHMDYVDPNFFDVLDLPLVAGDRKSALADPDDVVITQSVANKYFGATAVLGRPLTLFFHGVPRVHRISAVLRDIPANSHLHLAVVAPLTPALESDPSTGLTAWGGEPGYTYVRFKNQADARFIEAELPIFVHRRAHDPTPGSTIDIGKMLRLNLTPVAGLHFADARLQQPMRPGVDVRLIYALALVGTLTLVIAALNYVNLATARSALRAKEIALRKVLGATRGTLMLQLLIEAAALAFIAVLIGVAMAELSLPMVNAFGVASLKLIYWGVNSDLPWLLALALAIGLGAGFYPALLLSRFEPASVLAASRTPGGGRGETRLRAILIGAQFAVAVVFTICTLVIGSQARFIRDADRGFRRNDLILLDNLGAVLLSKRQNQLLDAFRRVPGVVSAAASLREPGLPQGEALTFVHRPGVNLPPITIAQDVISDGYLQTYGAQLAAGRMFDRVHGLDDINGPFEGSAHATARGVDVMLNESAARVLGFASPAQAVGQRLSTGDDPKTVAQSVPIIGVLRDVHFGSPQHPVAPVVYRYDSQSFEGGAVGAVRFVGVSDAVMIARLQAAWRREAPTVPFLAKTAEASLSDFYLPDEQRSRLFSLGSLLAVAIGCVGLYGLAMFTTARRVREIGIRKTLGASTSDILRLLIGQFLRPVLLANAIAWPLAWLAMRNWLSGFDQRIDLGIGYFLAASLLTLVIALATIAGHAIAVARAEPARALRHE